jgi:DnaJ-class molecular chaperone
MSVVIVNTIPSEKRCETCDGWGYVGVHERFGETSCYSTKICPDCYGSGLRKPEPIPYRRADGKGVEG